jgi:hypothetical protein
MPPDEKTGINLSFLTFFHIFNFEVLTRKFDPKENIPDAWGDAFKYGMGTLYSYSILVRY